MSRRLRRRLRRRCLAVVAATAAALVGLAALSRPALAHAGSLAGSLRTVPAPFWLVVLSGGGVVGVSFLFSSFVTDAEALDAVADRRLALATASDRLRPVVGWAAVAALAAVVWFGFAGPRVPQANLAVLGVWVGWWAGFTMLTYLVGNPWPAVNPWRTLARAVRRVGSVPSRPLPDRVGSWPAVVGLVVLVWVEVVSPVASDPCALAVAVLGYTALTVAGAARYGSAWFERVDPVSRVFRLYGLLAPIQWDRDGVASDDGGGAGDGDGGATDDEGTRTGVSLAVPGSALVRYPESMREDDAAFVVALLWVTTYDGLVATAAWREVSAAVATAGVPTWVLSLAVAFAGFACFLGVYRLAARLARATADTYVTARFVAGWFAPALLPIAAGYHLAHFLGYFLGLSPALLAVLASPLSPPAAVPVLAVPAWFGGLQLAVVVGGHLVAVWVAHARSFEVFPGRLQPLRSQYPFVAVTVAYTMTSLWVVAQPVADSLT